MRIYVGQSRSSRWIERLVDLGFVECTSRGELPSRRDPWFYDNGAYADFTAKRPFDAAAFRQDVATIAIKIAAGYGPDFLVVPDVVAGGLESLRVSSGWLEELRRDLPGCELYLAVQDGMAEASVADLVGRVDGIFVGGTMRWKLDTGAMWVAFAHRHGRSCHIGRCGTRKRVAWARRIGADSLDSCLPLWSEENLDSFLAGLSAAQVELPVVP